MKHITMTKKPLSVVGCLALIASMPAMAQASLEEIVVTAQKREQSLQDTPLAITALGTAELQSRQFSGLEDIVRIAPGVISTQQNGMNRLFIRGIGMNSVAEGNDPSSAFHVDGVYVGRPSAQLTSVFDIERIEVVRGPQGTLYGRNATGGSVNVITRKPTEEFEGYLRSSFGNYSSLSVEGALSGSLSGDETLLGRLAFKTAKRDGYAYNVFLNRETDDQDMYAVRGSLQWNAADRVSVFLSAEHSEEDDENYASGAFGAYPGFSLLGPAIIGDRDTTAVSTINTNKREFSALTGEIGVDFNENWTFKSISGWRSSDYCNTYDPDNTSIAFLDFYGCADADQLSQEAQFVFSGDRLDFIAGLFYFDEEISVDRRVPFDVAIGPGQLYHVFGDLEVEAYALFAQATYSVTPDFRVTLGARYSDEERAHDGFFRGVPNNVVPIVYVVQSKSWDDVTPKIGIEYDLGEDLLFYASYTEGFKSGSYNIGQNNAPAGSNDHSYDPETIEAYEMGLKGTFFDGKIQAALTGFYYDYADLQVNKVIGIQTATVNAATAENKGIEFEITSLLGDYVLIDADVTYLDPTFEEFESINPITNQLDDLSGNMLPGAAEWTVNFGAEITLPFDISGDVVLRGDMNYISERYFSEFNDPEVGEDSVTTYTASLRYTTEDGRYHASLWGKNLTDEEYTGNKFLSVKSFGAPIAGSWAAPRTYGVTVGIDF